MQRIMQCRRAASVARAAGLILVTGLVGALAPAQSAQAQVQWRAGAGAAPKKQSKEGLSRLLTTMSQRASKQHLVAHFSGPLTGAQKELFKASGLELLDYVGSNAYFAALKPGMNPGQIVDRDVLLTVEEVNTAWKLHSDLAAGIIRGHVVVEGLKNFNLEVHSATTQQQLEVLGLDPILAVGIALHSDASVDAVADAVRNLGGQVIYRYQSLKGMDIQIPMSRVRALAGDDAVRYIEPAMPPLGTCNDDARVRTNVDLVNAAPYNLNGAGIDVLVYDGGTIAAHPGLAGRITTGDSSGNITHATHVAGTIGGTGAGETGNPHRGMAPGVARFFAYGVEGFTQGYFRQIVGDTEADYLAGIAQGADVANNSVGSNIESNGWECTFQGDYGLFNEMLDSLIRGERNGQNGLPFRTIWAAGNERQGSRCQLPAEPQSGMGFYSCAPPQAGKNQVAVGAINSNNDSITTFTSFGPTDDGRLKPDFCAPGCQSDGDGGLTSCNGASGYTAFCGTSMASPTTTGVAALFLQDWRALFTGMPDPLCSTIKTIFAHTAVDIDDVGPDYRTGFGSIRADAIINQLRSGNFLEADVSQGNSFSFVVVVNPGDPLFKCTLAWDDFRGVANVNPNLVNDLDLVVTSPTGVRHFPWTLNPAIPDDPAVRTQEDHLNNIEQVSVSNPQAGGWLIEVRGTNVPQGPQKFSVAASPLLVNCSDAGNASLDRSQYSCSATSAGLRVVDCGLNSSDTVVDMVNVLVSSTSSPSGMVVTLTETAPEAAAFLGSIPLTTTNAPGALQIAANDVITMVYMDADNGSGQPVTVTDTATVDCTAPVITSVVVASVAPRGATITFTTDEAAQGRIRFGTSCGALTSMSDLGTFGTEHTISIAGLQTNTSYFFAVDATDAAANSSSNDNSGSCFTFMTPVVPDFYTEEFTGDFDMANRKVTYEAVIGNPDFYAACGESASALPTDPAGGTQIVLSDDSNARVDLTGGAQVHLYGINYTGFWVGSNGYITFNSGESDYTESLDEHFSQPRISMCYDDLNPGAGGSVRRQQLADRVVITWLNVPEYNTNNSNTMQIELFFNGRIRTTWLAMASSDSIAGLSRGGGRDPDFLESDLSSIGCGPRAPVATGGNFAVFAGNNLPITLQANDDGVPAALTYIVTQLPTHGRLKDVGTGSFITSAPYVLINGGRNVIYRPLGTYVGADQFQFKANDGGTPPAGGDSNTATVVISVDAIGPTPAAEFLVNNQNPGWTMQGTWAFGQPTGGGSFNHDPTSGFTGNNVLGYNLGGDYERGIFPTLYLTSTPINLTGRTGATLEFRRWLGIEAAPNDHANIQISSNGTTWNTVWDHTGPAIAETAWSLQTYDISQWADNRNNIQLRWGMGTTNGSITYPGWNLDDIRVLGTIPTPSCPCDWNGSGGINSQDLFDFLTGFFSNDADYNADGFTNSQDFFDFLGCFFTNCL